MEWSIAFIKVILTFSKKTWFYKDFGTLSTNALQMNIFVFDQPYEHMCRINEQDLC